MIDALTKDDQNCYILEADLNKLGYTQKEQIYEMLQKTRCIISLSLWD
jgi:hypothetical protein